MSERSEIEQILAKDRLLISMAMFAIFLLAAVYTLMGIGMPMSAVEMTFGSNEMSMKDMSTGGMSSMMMPAVWSVNYAALVI